MPQREGYENAVNFTISLCLVFTICVGLLRLWIRRNAYGRDDVVIGAATLVSFGQTGSSYAALAAGLGRSWSGIQTKEDLAALNKASTAGIVLFLLGLYLSKCAMVAFLTRITKTPSQIKLYHACNIFIGILGVVSIITVVAGCPVSPSSGYYWAFGSNAASCPSQSARWQTATGLDVITEIVLLALPIHLVWSLQMRLTKKAMIIVAFWIRLPVLGLSIGRNHYTMHLRGEGSDAGLDSAIVVIWLEIELAYAIASSTLSAMKTFTESFASGFGMGFTRGKGDDSYGMSNVSGSSGQSSKNEKSTKSACPNSGGNGGDAIRHHKHSKGAADRIVPATAASTSGEPGLRLRPETEIATFTSVSAEPATYSGDIWRANSSASDSSADDMVIVRETGYEVQHDRVPILPVAGGRA